MNSSQVNAGAAQGKIVAFSVLIVLTLFPWALAQTSRIPVSRIDDESGLSQNTVHAILKDQRGLVWIATQAGLNMYDGHRVRAFSRDDDQPESLSAYWITSLQLDPSGAIWVGTWDGGLNLFDPITTKAVRLNPELKDGTSLADFPVWSIHVGSNGNLWVGTLGGGVVEFDRETRTVRNQFLNDPDDSGSLSANRVRCLYEDRRGDLWIGTSGGGLNRWDHESETFEHFRHDPSAPGSLSHDHVWGVYEAPDGAFWIATSGGGLNKFQPATRTFKAFRQGQGEGSISSDQIFGLTPGDRGELWLATWGGGLNRFDTETEQAQVFDDQESSQARLSSNELTTVSFSDGLVWVGTGSAGLDRFPAEVPFTSVSVVDGPKGEGSSVGSIFAFAEVSKDRIWLGGSAGLFEFNSETFEVRTTRDARLTAGLPEFLSVTDLRIDSENQVWIGTFRQGIYRVDLESGKVDVFINQPDNPRSLSNDSIGRIIEDSKGRIWVGTAGGGLARYEPGSNDFKRIGEGSDAERASVVSNLYEDATGVIWVSTHTGGLCQVTAEDGIRCLPSEERPPAGTGTKIVNAVTPSLEGKLWVGTGRGLLQLDPGSETFESVQVSDGRSFPVVYSLSSSESERIWVSSNEGLFSFRPDSLDAEHFTRHDGLPSNDFNQGAVFKDSSGRLYFGSDRGFVSFQPDKVGAGRVRPKVALTEASVMRGRDRTRPLLGTSELNLDPDENSLTFEFALTDYRWPEGNSYAYRLEGFDESWQQVGRRNFVQYTSLESGAYRFLVKGRNSNGIWSEPAELLNFSITKPVWAEWWFLMIVGLGLTGAVLGTFRLRTRALEAINNRLTAEVEDRTKALRLVNEELAAENAMRIQAQGQLEVALKKTRIEGSRIEKILDSHPWGLMFINSSGQVEMINNMGVEMVGAGLDELRSPIAGSAQQQSALDFVAEVCRQEEVNFEAEYQAQDGTEPVVFAVSVFPVEHAPGEFGSVVAFQDVSEMKRAERMRNEFIPVAAHEMRTPLTSVLGFCEILLNRKPSEAESEHYLTIIYKQANQLKSLIDTLLDLGRIEAGEKIELNFQEVDLGQVVSSVVEPFRGAASGREFVVNGFDDIPPFMADELRVSQVLRNLVSNAEKFSDEDQPIEVLGSLADGMVRVRVIDRGRGMSPEQQKGLFKSFYRVAGTRVPGTGLGLVIARRIVLGHGGEMQVTSVLGVGTEFSFTLPFRLQQ